MAITVACGLNIYVADLTSKYPSSDDLSGLIELRICSRYQLLIQADPENGGLQIPLDDIFNPEICTCITIPRDFFLVKEVTESYVEEKLSKSDVDDNTIKILAPEIAEFAKELAERRRTGEIGKEYAMVAEVWIEKADYIYKEELSRIAGDLNAERGTCINVDDPHFFNGISDVVAEINSYSLPLPF